MKQNAVCCFKYTSCKGSKTEQRRKYRRSLYIRDRTPFRGAQDIFLPHITESKKFISLECHQLFLLKLLDQISELKSFLLAEAVSGKRASFFDMMVKDFIVKLLDGKSVELQIWDTAGQERYASMLPMYLRNAVAAVIVYDVTDRDSFFEIKKWVNEVERGSTVPVSLFVVGNKLDLESARVVQYREGAQYAEQIGAAFHETSAMNGEGIRKVNFVLN
uniref:Ras family protein n=1 Tax=Wuchereria bancrofti TaxID=6293 RepID=A0A1I8EJW9_WUCBA